MDFIHYWVGFISGNDECPSEFIPVGLGIFLEGRIASLDSFYEGQLLAHRVDSEVPLWRKPSFYLNAAFQL